MFDGRAWHEGRPLVLVEGARVIAVETTGARPPGDLEVVDLGDATLLPGLVDAHVHLAFDSADRAQHGVPGRGEPALLELMRRNARQQLRAGVTTVRDLGDRDYLAVALRERGRTGGGEEDGPMPEIVASGPPLTRTRGHCWFLGGEADTVADLRAAVARHARHGVDLIKIMATGGATTPGWAPHESQYRVAELAAATGAAHARGLPVTAHAHGAGGIGDAVAAGVDGVEHCSFFTADGVAADWGTVAAMARAGTFVGATEAWLAEGEMLAPHLADRLERRSENFVRMHREGVRVVCCSDAGAGPRKPHGVLPRGALHFGSIGFTTTEALASVTTVAAESCGVADRKGRVAAGYDADLLAVAGDPRRRLEALLDVRAVLRAGRFAVRVAHGRAPAAR